MLTRKTPLVPVGGYRINRGHSRAQGLCFFAPLRDAYGLGELHSGQMMTPTGLGSRFVTRGGMGLGFGASSYADFVKPPEIGATTPFTVAWTQEARSGSSYSTILNCNFGSGSNCFIIYQESGASGYGFTAGPRGGGVTAQSWTAALGAVVNDRLDRFVLRVAGGSQSTTSSDYTLFRNGLMVTRGTATSFSLYTSAAARIGARETGADPWEGAILDMRMWARVLSDAEATIESTQERVGELYEPRRIWVPAEVASSGVTGTSATTNANDTSSASGTTTVVGTAATTNANDTATASGVVGSPVIGTSATTNANDTPSASGITTVTGTSATTNANDSPAASGWAGAVTGMAAVTNANDAAQASGTVEGGFPFGGTGGGLAQIKPRESDEQKRTRRIAQGIIREAQKPSADVGKLAKKAGKVSAQLRSDVSYYEAEAAKYAKEIEQSKQAIALVMQARNDALATRQLEQRMIQAQLLAEAAAQQIEELDVVFMAVMLAALE